MGVGDYHVFLDEGRLLLFHGNHPSFFGEVIGNLATFQPGRGIT